MKRFLSWRLWLPALALCGVIASPIDAASAPDTIQGYIRQLADPAQAQVGAAALCRAGTEVIDPLCAALTEKDPLIRAGTAQVLSLLAALLTAPEQRTRVVNALLTALHDAVPAVRAVAAGALGALQDRRAVDALCEALTDADRETEVNAAFALGEIGDARALTPLLRQTRSPDARECAPPRATR